MELGTVLQHAGSMGWETKLMETLGWEKKLTDYVQEENTKARLNYRLAKYGTGALGVEDAGKTG